VVVVCAKCLKVGLSYCYRKRAILGNVSFISIAVATCFIKFRTTDDHRIKMCLAAM